MNEPWQVPGEGDILAALRMLAEFSRVYWLMLQGVRPEIERLSEDDSRAALLLTTLTAAISWPAYLGTPRHVEQLARDILKNLPDP